MSDPAATLSERPPRRFWGWGGLFFGKLPARYKFFLNPYSDMRFTPCPQCEGKTSQKKVPLMIHVDPLYPVNLNYTCRYCPKCDIRLPIKMKSKITCIACFPSARLR